MRSQSRRYLLFLLLLLLSAGWVFLMSLDMSENFQAPAADGVHATITWLDWQGTGFPRVEAHVSMLDAAGQPVRGLAADAFTLHEDGFAISIQEFLGSGEQAVTTILVIDRSGSMDGDKIIGARAAANIFVDQMHPERDRAGLIAFDHRVDTLQPLTNRVDALHRLIKGIAVDGGTAFYDAVYQGLQGLQGENGRRIILALTDGLDTASSRTPQEIIQLAQTEGIAVYTIGLGEDRAIFSEVDGDTLRLIAAETGGEFHLAPSANELATLYQRIAEVVQNEYVLGYDSPSPNLDGTTRQVEVAISREVGSVTAVGSYAVSGVLSSAFDVALFVPLFVVLLLVLLLLLLLPGWLHRWQQRQLEGATAVPTPPPFYPPAPPQVLPSPPSSGAQIIASPQSCSQCGYSITPGKKFCPQCGQPAVNAVPPAPTLASFYCRHCGNLLRAGAKFCAHCGQSQ